MLYQACLELFYISLKAFFALQINIWTGLTGFCTIFNTVKCCFLTKKNEKSISGVNGFSCHKVNIQFKT